MTKTPMQCWRSLLPEELKPGFAQPCLAKFLAEDVIRHLEARRLQLVAFFSAPGFGKDFRIVEGELDLERVAVDAPEAFRQLQGVAMRSPQAVEPALLVDLDRLRDERVAVVPSSRVPVPGRRIALDLFSARLNSPH